MSGAVWLLSTRGRPKEAQETIDACMDAGMTSRGVVYIDGTPDQYRLKLPRNWEAHPERDWRGLQGSMQWCYWTHPDASQYGWLADDVRPRTRGWDKLLEAAAGDWCLAYARDLWMSESEGQREPLEVGRDLSSGLVWGGQLVRTVGWWALPGVMQAGIDTAWTEIVRPLSLHRYRHDITVEHLNWRTGKRPMDDTDRAADHIDPDIARRNDWAASPEYRHTLRRLAAAAGHPGGPLVDGALRESYANELWRDGALPSARLQRIMEGGVDIDKLDGVGPDTYTGQAGLAAAGGPVGAGANV